MIPFSEIKVGDYLFGEFEGKTWEGQVTRLNRDDKQVCVETEVQEFWFETAHLQPIPLDEASMMNLSFEKEVLPDGSIKYKKGAFRILLPAENDFANAEIWYRQDKRHHPELKYVHQLQNHYLEMTKVHLTKEALV